MYLVWFSMFCEFYFAFVVHLLLRFSAEKYVFYIWPSAVVLYWCFLFLFFRGQGSSSWVPSSISSAQSCAFYFMSVRRERKKWVLSFLFHFFVIFHSSLLFPSFPPLSSSRNTSSDFHLQRISPLTLLWKYSFSKAAPMIPYIFQLLFHNQVCEYSELTIPSLCSVGLYLLFHFLFSENGCMCFL